MDYNQRYEEMKALHGEKQARKMRDAMANNHEAGRYDGPFSGGGGGRREGMQSQRYQRNRQDSKGFYLQRESEYRDGDDKRHAALNDRVKKLEAQKKAAPAAPKAQPKGDQQIDEVKYSPEITGAQKIANDYMSSLKDKKSPWADAQADVASSSGPSGLSAEAPQKDPQDFADKYKLNLINSGATKQNNTDFTSGGESSMSSADILKRDRQMYG